MLVTINTMHRAPVFSSAPKAREVIETLYRIQTLHPFHIFAFVIMPDHCHFLLSVTPPFTISRLINILKSGVSHSIGEGPLWQPRFHLRIVENIRGAIEYIHQNPVRACLREQAEEYEWSSASGKWDVTLLCCDM
jgi:putative transposase